jgi:hypothetical protein
MKKSATNTIGTSKSELREDKPNTPINAVFKNKTNVVQQNTEIKAINSTALLPNNHNINRKKLIGAKQKPVTNVNCW